MDSPLKEGFSEKMAMKRVTRSMKRNESNENDPISVLPLELKAEILTKLPPKSIARLGCVSKHWSSITRAKYFTDLYLARSPTRPRLLFSVYRGGDMQTQFFHSCSQDDPTSSSDSDKVSYTLNSDQRFMFTPPICSASFSAMAPFCLLSYDPKEYIAKKNLIEEIGDQFANIRVYLDHVDRNIK